MVSERLQAWVRREFGPAEADVVLALLADLSPPGLEAGPDAVERVQAAVVILARRDSRRFLEAAALAEVDWRDVLVAADLADADWPDRLDATLGTVRSSG